jgi:hypothetical protein
MAKLMESKKLPNIEQAGADELEYEEGVV